MILFNTTEKFLISIPQEIQSGGNNEIYNYAIQWAVNVHDIVTHGADWLSIKEDYWHNFSIVWFTGFMSPSLYWNDEANEFIHWDQNELPPPLPQTNPFIVGGGTTNTFAFTDTATVNTATETAVPPSQWSVDNFDGAAAYIDSLLKDKMATANLLKKKAPKKKTPIKFDSPESEINHLKKELRDADEALAMQEQAMEKVQADYRLAVQKYRDKEIELSMLKASTVDSDKLKNRIKVLSKQLGVPLVQAKNVNQVMDDFIAQLWCRIKHEQTGPDELAS